MPGWESWHQLVRHEFEAALEEGRDPVAVQRLQREFEATRHEDVVFAEWAEKLRAIPMAHDYSFHEPNDLNEIRRLRAEGPRRIRCDLSDEVLLDKLHGAWLGRCVGCALGKPIEDYMSARDGIASWQRQKRYLEAIAPEEWPLRDYIPQHSPAEAEVGRVGCHPSTREGIAFMETDDDIRYTVIGQLILLEKGRNFTTLDVARAWIDNLPYKQVCTAETQAYRNLVARYSFHLDSTPEAEFDWEWVATHDNPFRQWIGAQIRVDSYGYAAPGNPELAAEFAWRDARLSHVKNGLYGAMFCAAMIAAAFATDDPREIVEAGLAEIPQTSRLYIELRQVIEICARHNNTFDSFESVIEDIYALLGHYHPIHTNNNAGLCLAGVLLSGGDFEKGITFAVMGGWDTDCNGATVGSVVGAMNGARKAPSHWTKRLNNTLNSSIINYHPIEISECARRSQLIAHAIRDGK